jgi:hypothetical protein
MKERREDKKEVSSSLEPLCLVPTQNTITKPNKHTSQSRTSSNTRQQLFHHEDILTEVEIWMSLATRRTFLSEFIARNLPAVGALFFARSTSVASPPCVRRACCGEERRKRKKRKRMSRIGRRRKRGCCF